MSNMYSRNKQRKEQQLLNLRQLTAKIERQPTEDRSPTRPPPSPSPSHTPSRSPPQSMANRSPVSQTLTSTTTTTTTTPTEPTISPEILFLVQQQAKTIAHINSLQKRVEQLENQIKQNRSNEDPIQTTSASSSSARKLVNSNSDNNISKNNSKERIAISDDSGGEYSRLTTTSDDDELSLLLDQIARRSQQLQSSHQISNRLANVSISSSLCGKNNGNNSAKEVLPQSMQSRPKRHSDRHSERHTYPRPSAHLSHPLLHNPNQSPTREPSLERKAFGNFSNISTLMTTQASTQAVQPSAPPLASTQSQSPFNQSISALLFEPNVENVLKNLDDIIATEAIDSNKFSNASTLSQTSQQFSLYDNNSSNTFSSPHWQLERAKSLVKQREEREVNRQIKLNEEWLQTQLKADPKRFNKNNFIDSLETSRR